MSTASGSSWGTGGILCSVVIPFRQVDAYAELAIASVSSQTLFAKDPLRVELVAVLHSQDEDCLRRLERLTSAIPRRQVLVYRGPHVPDARNIGIEAANGWSYAVLDADDFMHPNRLETQITHLKSHPECSAVGSWANIIDESGRLLHVSRPSPVVSFRFQHGLFYQPALIHSSLMCRMDDAKRLRYAPWFRAAHDQELLLRLGQTGRLMNVQEALIAHRNHRCDRRLSFRHRRFQALATVRLAQMLEAGVQYQNALAIDPSIAFSLSINPARRNYYNWLYKMILLERDSTLDGFSLRILRDFVLKTCAALIRGHVSPRTAVLSVARFVVRSLT